MNNVRRPIPTVWQTSAADFLEVRYRIRACSRFSGSVSGRPSVRPRDLTAETGWQLSHGKRSRLFLAHPVLQGATCLILDESFAALDPAMLHQVLRCVLERVPTLVVIAHP